METFTEARTLVRNDGYAAEREAALAALDLDAIDAPIVDVVEAFRPLTHCFTLQCCYGHFLTMPGQDERSLSAIPDGFSGAVHYRIAYIAFCVDTGDRGRALLQKLSRVPEIEPAYMQFGSADWFWDQWPNSYTLQVEPAAHRFKDQAVLTTGEAMRTQRARDQFFEELRRVLAEEPEAQDRGG